MPTRSGKSFSIREIFAPINSSIQDKLDVILARMGQMAQRLQEYRDQTDANCMELGTRLDRLETNRKENPKSLRGERVPS